MKGHGQADLSRIQGSQGLSWKVPLEGNSKGSFKNGLKQVEGPIFS